MKIAVKHILCPVDLTPESNEALGYAASLARAYDARLLVCHCVENSPLADGEGRLQLRKMFEELVADQVSDADSVGRCEAVVVEEDPVSAIPRIAAERGVDLIVMRSRRRPHAAALLGSTAEAVCRTAPCPVLVTHPGERELIGKAAGAGGQLGIKRLLVAYDFSNDSELALAWGLALAQEYQAELHLLHVLPPAEADELFEQAARRLHNAVPGEAYLWCEVREEVGAGRPYREILAYAEEHAIDLICLGKHGANFAMRALFGSNADRVLRQAPCPVLIARPLRPTFINPVETVSREAVPNSV
jgi:nucleotide-binding universal stress UspA family protein